MVFIIVVQFSLKNIKGFINSYQSFLLSCFIIANVEPRATSIGLRWEIKKAFIVSSNLGDSCTCARGELLFDKIDFFALLEFVRIGKISIRLFCFYGKDNINN